MYTKPTHRWHSKGTPIVHEIPPDSHSRTWYRKHGYVLKDDARITAWIITGDNCHEFAVFHVSQVYKGKDPLPRRVTVKMVEREFERLLPLLPRERRYALNLLTETREYFIDWSRYSEFSDARGVIWLSGEHRRGTLAKALIALSAMIAREKGKV